MALKRNTISIYQHLGWWLHYLLLKSIYVVKNDHVVLLSFLSQGLGKHGAATKVTSSTLSASIPSYIARVCVKVSTTLLHSYVYENCYLFVYHRVSVFLLPVVVVARPQSYYGREPRTHGVGSMLRGWIYHLKHCIEYCGLVQPRTILPRYLRSRVLQLQKRWILMGDTSFPFLHDRTSFVVWIHRVTNAWFTHCIQFVMPTCIPPSWRGKWRSCAESLAAWKESLQYVAIFAWVKFAIMTSASTYFTKWSMSRVVHDHSRSRASGVPAA